MDSIVNNPFRVLGLPPSANDKEITKRVSDLIIYAEMSKNVQFESDFEFLGYINRGTKNIKEAAKKLENNELKIFYSLMYFEIKDEVDRKAIQFLEYKDYKSAISLWENAIFNKCPIILRGSKIIEDVLKNPFFKDSIKPHYSIKSIIKFPWPIPEYKISSHFDNDDVHPLMESLTLIKELSKYQISCNIKFESNTSLGNKIGLALVCSEKRIKHIFILDSNGNFILEEDKTDVVSSPRIIAKEPFDITYFKEKSILNIKIYNRLIEVWLNDHKIFTAENNITYNSFCFQISGSQIITIDRLVIQELGHLKLYSEDINIDEVTFPYVKNLSLLYILKTEINDTPIFLDYFELLGNFFKQNYFKEYAKQIISPNYEINFSSLTDIYIQEFYSEFKNKIDPDNEFSVLGFYDPFRHLSDEAKDKAIERLVGGRVYTFEETIKNISSQRINKSIESKILAQNLIQLATPFFNWFSSFNGYKGGAFSNLWDKVGKELLECGIAHYNNAPQKTVQIATESINIIKQSSEFSKSSELRDRIVKNLKIISESHGLVNEVIDFREKDLKNLWDSISFKGTKKEVPISKKLEPVTSKEQKTIIEFRQEPATTKKQVKKKVFPKIKNPPKYIVYGLLIALIIIVVSIINDSKNDSDKSSIVPISLWTGNKLYNGASPYENYFGQSVFDYNSQCWLLFRNGNSTDVIVCLENVSTGQTIRNVYIQAGTNYTMSNLPTGVYQVKVFYGNDWNPEKTINNGLIKGAFDTDLSFSISDNINDRILVKTTEDYSGITYTTGEITLYKVSNGNMQQRNINSKDFFK
jgi:hypothetical protein